MALFDQLILNDILNGRNGLSNTKLRAEVAYMSDEQKTDYRVFLKFNTEELAGLPDGLESRP